MERDYKRDLGQYLSSIEGRRLMESTLEQALVAIRELREARRISYDSLYKLIDI